VALLGRLAARTPLASRLALRDLARYRTRSGASLAAVSFAVFTAVIIVLLSTGRLADPVDYAGPNLPANQLLIRPDLRPDGPDPAAAPPAQPDPVANAAIVETIAAALHTTDVLPLQDTGLRLGQGKRGDPGTIWLATPEVLRHYGIDPASIKPDTVLVSSRRGLDRASNLVVFTGPHSDPYQHPTIQLTSALPTGASQPNLLLTAYGAQLLNVDAVPDGWLIQTPKALTDGQTNTARELALAASMRIETKSGAASADELRTVATSGGILLALGVLAMSVGLIRSEAARDLPTLAATGASSWVRRRISAATAGSLGLVGAVWGVAVGYLAAIALFHNQLSQRLGQVPVLDLALILIGLPLAAALGSWMLAGREPSVIARRAIQ
jgi:putative ABC transport system permease protein